MRNGLRENERLRKVNRNPAETHNLAGLFYVDEGIVYRITHVYPSETNSDYSIVLDNNDVIHQLSEVELVEGITASYDQF